MRRPFAVSGNIFWKCNKPASYSVNTITGEYGGNKVTLTRLTESTISNVETARLLGVDGSEVKRWTEAGIIIASPYAAGHKPLFLSVHVTVPPCIAGV